MGSQVINECFRLCFMIAGSGSALDGAELHLVRVTRQEMAAYLCIASNGIPPSVSKRIMLTVECNTLNYINFTLCLT